MRRGTRRQTSYHWQAYAYFGGGAVSAEGSDLQAVVIRIRGTCALASVVAARGVLERVLRPHEDAAAKPLDKNGPPNPEARAILRERVQDFVILEESQAYKIDQGIASACQAKTVILIGDVEQHIETQLPLWSGNPGLEEKSALPTPQTPKSSQSPSISRAFQARPADAKQSQLSALESSCPCYLSAHPGLSHSRFVVCVMLP